MKINAILVSGLTAASQIAQAGQQITLPVKYLNQLGINPTTIRDAYRDQANIEIDWNEVLKVSTHEEGKYINVNTIDGITVVVPIELMSGPENKVDIPGPK